MSAYARLRHNVMLCNFFAFSHKTLLTICKSNVVYDSTLGIHISCIIRKVHPQLLLIKVQRALILDQIYID